MGGRGMVTIESVEQLTQLLRVLRDFGVSRANINGLEVEFGQEPARHLHAAAEDVEPSGTATLSTLPRTDPLFDGVEAVG